MEHLIILLLCITLACLSKSDVQVAIVAVVILIAAALYYNKQLDAAAPLSHDNVPVSAKHDEIVKPIKVRDTSDDNVPPSQKAVDPYAYPVTIEDMQRRRDALTYKKEHLQPSSASRSRVLEEMYKELINTSIERDPALRENAKKGENCAPLRGLRAVNAV